MAAYPGAIGNVFRGRSADGMADLRTRIEFSPDTEVRQYFAAMIDRNILEPIKQSGAQLSNTDLTNLIQKLILYCSEESLRVKEAGSDNLTKRILAISHVVVDAVIENTSIFSEEESIENVLAAHRRRITEKIANLKQQLAIAPPSSEPPVILRSNVPGYYLAELIEPAHLQQETIALGHCIGTTHNSALLRERGLSPSDLDARAFLHYARRIAGNKSRIFSLRGPDGPTATIEYDNGRKRIVQIEGKNIDGVPGTIKGTAIFFPALCDSLDQLASKIDIRKIDGLDLAYPHGEVVIRTDSGIQYVGYSKEVAPDVIAGRVHVTNAFSDEAIHRFAQSPLVFLDVTRLSDLSRLLSKVKAPLYSNSSKFEALHLVEASDMHLPMCKDLNIPALEEVGAVYFDGRKQANISKLRKAEIIATEKRTTLHAPELVSVDFIHGPKIERLEAPKLRTMRGSDIPKNAVMLTPRLRRQREIGE